MLDRSYDHPIVLSSAGCHYVLTDGRNFSHAYTRKSSAVRFARSHGYLFVDTTKEVGNFALI